jgi:NAD(P)-dependent dehydrogenase (short-subunit alcohol dehydrogenase family)
VLLSRSLPGSLPKLELDIPEDRLLALRSDGSQATLSEVFKEMEKKWPGAAVEVGVFNAGGNFNPGGFLSRTEEQFRDNLESFAWVLLPKGRAEFSISSFTFGQAIIPHLLKTAKDVLAKPPSKERRNPTLIFTGATMSNRSGAQFSVMAPGKLHPLITQAARRRGTANESAELCKVVCWSTGMFARKAVAQSLAREFGPQGIHVSHVVIDGMIDTPGIREKMGEDKEEKVRLETRGVEAVLTTTAP